MVVINYANEEKEFSIHKGKVGNTQWQIYRTSDKEGENLLPVRAVKSGSDSGAFYCNASRQIMEVAHVLFFLREITH